MQFDFGNIALRFNFKTRFSQMFSGIRTQVAIEGFRVQTSSGFFVVDEMYYKINRIDSQLKISEKLNSVNCQRRTAVKVVVHHQKLTLYNSLTQN